MRRSVQFLLLGVLIACIQVPGFTQAEEADENLITDEELTRYAEVMDSIEVLKAQVQVAIKDMVSNTEVMNAARYNDIYRYAGKSEKLAELEATESEVDFLNQVEQLKDSMTTQIKSTFTTLAKEYVGEGGRTYNKVSRALKSDEEVKARYQAILNEVQARRKEGEEPGTEEEVATEEGNN